MAVGTAVVVAAVVVAAAETAISGPGFVRYLCLFILPETQTGLRVRRRSTAARTFSVEIVLYVQPMSVRPMSAP